jgi:hypothetical protein
MEKMQEKKNSFFFACCSRCVMSQLKHLTDSELSMVRQAFTKNAHLRYLKEFFYHQPYGKRELYNQEVQTAGLEKLAKLIHVTALLLQAKVYLFWRTPSLEA